MFAWLVIFSILAAGAAVVGTALYFDSRERCQHRAAFLAGRRRFPDAAFRKALGCSADIYDICLAVREAMAEECLVGRDFIHPFDTIESLLPLQFDGGDLLEVGMRLKSLLLSRGYGRKIVRNRMESCRIPQGLGSMNFGEFAIDVAEHLGKDVTGSRGFNGVNR
jgi:hypothetical protein